MRTKTSTWFETTIKYGKVDKDGSTKLVNETYVIDGLSFTEAEDKTIEEMAVYIIGESEVKAIKKAGYSEVIFSDEKSDALFYKAKVKFITLDEKTGKEKATAVTYLVQANSLPNAVDNVSKAMQGTLGEWGIVTVAETKIIDVFEHK